MKWKETYITIKNYLDKGINEIAWIKNIVAFVFYVSGIGYVLNLNAFNIALVFGITLLLFCFIYGWMYYEKLKLYEIEIEWQNKRHKGIKVRK